MAQSLADALAEINDPETIEQLLSGINESDNTQSSSPSSASNQSTLSKLYERFLGRRQNRSPATISNYKRTLPGFVRFAASRHALYPGEITTELVDAYVDSLLQEYDNDATILLHTSNVRPWLKWLILRAKNSCNSSHEKRYGEAGEGLCRRPPPDPGGGR
ncbi:site-specific integrase [Natronomonas moolapensis]|uniref:site-specific integrase n=1 Tax=Natronomonas moolapensis TaxID=416273 RepID=UPI00097987F7